MKPAPVTPLVEQLAAHPELGHPQAGYILYPPRPVGIAFGLLMACFRVSAGAGGLVGFGPALLQALHNHALAKSPDAGLVTVCAGDALGCSLIGLYLFSGAAGRSTARSGTSVLQVSSWWSMAKARRRAGIRSRTSSGTRKLTNQHDGWMYRFRH
jgi:hypothetical protein